MRELQLNRIREQLAEVLGTDNKIAIMMSDNGILEEAKINTDKELGPEMIKPLVCVADSWNCKLYIKRSGAGIRIKMVLEVDKLSESNRELHKQSRLRAASNARILEGHRGH